MPVFSYRAIDKSRAARQGEINSDSPRQARQQLRDMGLRVTELSQVSRSNRKDFSIPSIFKRSWNHWLVGFSSELATLISVGVPLVEALETLSQQYQGKSKSILLHLKDDVSSGRSIADAMKRQPEVFDSLTIKMLEVGQNTGNLDEILRQVSEFKRRSHEFKDRVLSALLYPLIIVAVSLGVSVFLMTVVVPMLPTRILQFGSNLLSQHGWWLGIVLLVSVIGIWLGIQTGKGRRFRDRFFLRIPLIGAMGQKQEISRIALVIATLMKSNVEFLPSVAIAKGTTKNTLLCDALDSCSRDVESGKEIGKSLGQSSYFPPMVVQVFTVGQQSGRMEEMLFRLSKDYDQQVESLSGRLSTVIEPALILILSFFIGFIMFATLMPMMEAGNVF
jgi:type II secretory pathway component PulF